MMRVSISPVVGGRKIVNIGCRCLICGNCFDAGGFCNGGHEQGRTYYILPEPETKAVAVKPVVAEEMVICGVYSGCHCTICGAFFADGGDTICSNGHEIGQVYPKKVA